jgi:hypothetical protein
MSYVRMVGVFTCETGVGGMLPCGTNCAMQRLCISSRYMVLKGYVFNGLTTFMSSELSGRKFMAIENRVQHLSPHTMASIRKHHYCLKTAEKDVGNIVFGRFHLRSIRQS